MTEPATILTSVWGQLAAQTVQLWIAPCRAAEAIARSVLESSYQEVPVPGVNKQEVNVPVTKDFQLACSDLQRFRSPADVIKADRIKLTKNGIPLPQNGQLKKDHGSPQLVGLTVAIDATTVSGDYEGSIFDKASKAKLAPVRVHIVGGGPAP